MEEPYEGENTNPEVIEDLYVLKTKIDTSDLTKLRRELQQVRYELAQAQSDVRRLRNSPEGSFSQVGNVNVTSQLKMEMERVKELKRQQAQIVNQINQGAIRDTEVFTRALSSMNNELENIGKNSRALEAAMTVMEGAMGRMAAISKKSAEYKQLQASFNNLGIEANVTGTGGRLDLEKVQDEMNRINNTPITVKFNDQEITTTISQLEFLEAILKRIAAQTKQNIVLTKVLAGQTTSSVLTPSAGGAIGGHAYVPPSFFVERAQSVNRDNTGFAQIARAVMAAFHGVPLYSSTTNQQVITGSSPLQPRGTSKEDVRNILTDAGLIKELPARNQFMTMGTSHFLSVSSFDKLSGVVGKLIMKMDSVVLADMRYIGDRYGGRRPVTNRSQMGGIIDGILSDEDIGNMEKAYHYQVAKMMSLYNVDWQDTGGPQYWRRGRTSANITDKQLAIMDLIDQFPGSMQSSEITHALEMGHYQSLNSPIRDLQKAGMLRRAIVPPMPIPEAGIENQIHPAIMAMLAHDPSLFLQFAMEGSPIKFMDTSERGRRTLEMMGMYNSPSRVNTGMGLNAMVTNPEETLVENYKSQMKLPPNGGRWLRGYNFLNYLDTPQGNKLIYSLEEMLNNKEAYNPEFINPLMDFIPTYVDAKSGRTKVNFDVWKSKDDHQLYPTNAGQYLGARSDINWALRTPYMFIDKLMETVARPNRDLFAGNMLGTEAYLQSVLRWASGPQGRGINPQLERYTITPEQATAHFKILFGALKKDMNLEKVGDKFEGQYGRQYMPYNQYEKSIIIRAANEMLKRALPVSTGMDPAMVDLMRSKAFMSKGEAGQVDKIFYGARQEEIANLLRAIPDLHRYIRAFEAYQKGVLDTFNKNTADLVGVFEENAVEIGTSKPVSPEMRRRIANTQDAAASWKKYPEFWDAGWGNTYEEMYTSGTSEDANVRRVALGALNAESEKKALRTKMPAVNIDRFRRDSQRSQIHGFTGVLPWNEALKYYSQYGSQDLNEEGMAEYARLMGDPAALMKELMWDYTYVEGENTKNPQIKNVIMDTYGTVMKKHAMFGWMSEIKDSNALEALQDIDTKFGAMFEPEAMGNAVRDYMGAHNITDTSDATLYNIEDTIVKQIQQQAQEAMRDWTEQFGIETVNTGDITNAFKMKPNGVPSRFYEYIPENVPVDDVIKRMLYDMQKGRMDPGLLDQYARAVASQKTRKDTGYSHKMGIESMWRNANWDYEEMANLPELWENQVLFGFARAGMGGTFNFPGKNYTAEPGWNSGEIINKGFGEGDLSEAIRAYGFDPSMVNDDALHQMINENMDFRGNVRNMAMEFMGIASEKEWNQYIQYSSQQMRQKLKRWERISASLIGSVGEFEEGFTNNYGSSGDLIMGSFEPPEVQSEFGNITTNIELIHLLKSSVYDRMPKALPKGAITTGIERAQRTLMKGSIDAQIRAVEREERNRANAWGFLQELPSVQSSEMFRDITDVRQLYGQSPAGLVTAYFPELSKRGSRSPEELDLISKLAVNQIKTIRERLSAANNDRSLGPTPGSGDGLISGVLDAIRSPRSGDGFVTYDPHSMAVLAASLYIDDKMNDEFWGKFVGVSEMNRGQTKGLGPLHMMLGSNLGISKGYNEMMFQPLETPTYSAVPFHARMGANMIAPQTMSYALPWVYEGFIDENVKKSAEDVKQPFGDSLLGSRTSSVTMNPAAKYARMMGAKPEYMPSMRFVTAASGDAPGYYNFIKNMIEIDKKAPNIDEIAMHEMTHAFINPKLASGDTLQQMVDLYNQNAVKKYSHSTKVGDEMVAMNKQTSMVERIDAYLGKITKSPNYQQELERLAPFKKLFASMSDDQVRTFFEMSEEVAIVMSKFDSDYEKHVEALFGKTASWNDRKKIAIARTIAGVPTEIPQLPKGTLQLPGPQYKTSFAAPGVFSETYDSKVAGLLPPGVTEIPQIYEYSGEMSGDGWNASRPVNGPERGAPLSALGMAELRAKQWQTARDANQRRQMLTNMGTMSDVSMIDPGKLVTERGTEIPMTYQLSGLKMGGAVGIYAEYDRIKKWMVEQGYDPSQLKHDVIAQTGEDGATTHQGILSGPLRIPDAAMKGRTIPAIMESLSDAAGEGYRSFNEQAARYEKTMDKVPKWTEAFGHHGKTIAGLSWQFTTLQMAALGIFFSMMSIVSVMGQGIGMVIGGIGDLDSMMKAKAMAGMSGQFTRTDESGNTNVLTGAYIDDALGITDQTRIDAWKNLTDFSSTLATMLSGFGSKVLTSPKFLEAAGNFLNKIFDVVTNEDSLKTVVDLSETLFETIGNIVDKLPSLIKLFDTIASTKVPEFVPGVGGQSALSVYGQAALMSLIAMPILAGVTLLTKLTGWSAESVGLLGSIKQWNTGRNLEKFLLKEGYPKEYAAAARAGMGIPQMTPEDMAFYKRMGINAEKIPSAGLPEGFATGITEAEKAARLAAGRQTAEQFAAQGIKVNGDLIASAMGKAAQAIETKSAGIMIFTREDLLPKGTLAAERNAALKENKIPWQTGMADIPGTDIMVDYGMIGNEVLYGQVNQNGMLANMPMIGPLYKMAQLIMSGRHVWDKANLTGKSASDVYQNYGWKVTNPETGEETPWTPGMEIPEEWTYDPGGVFGQMSEAQKAKQAERQKQAAMGIMKYLTSEFGFSYSDEVKNASTPESGFETSPVDIANKISEEPLSSKWVKENATSFNQTNYITMPTTSERLDSMDAKLNAVLRVLGA